MIKLSDIWCEELPHKSEDQSFCNLTFYTFETLSDLTEKLDISANEFLANPYAYGYAPIPQINLIAIQKDYLKILNNRSISNYFNRLSDDDFFKEFNRIFHWGDEADRFYDYYYHKKTEALIQWCKDNRLPFSNDR